MGSRGPIPQSNKLKLLKGNPGKRKLIPPKPTGDLDLDPSSMTPPDWLSLEATEVWNQIVPELCKMDILSVLDSNLVVIYCTTHARWIEASKVINSEGARVHDKHGALRPHPAVRESHQLAALSLQLEKELGLTPASRQRLNIPDPPSGLNPKGPKKKKRFFAS